MGYNLQAFIVHTADRNKLTDVYNNAVAIDIGQGLTLVPLTAALFEEINSHVKFKAVDGFDSLTEHIGAELFKHIGNIQIAYVEAEYFGGRGEQMAIIWKEQKRVYLSLPGAGEINKVLKIFGVVADKGSDEFDTLSLGRYRKTEWWVNGKY